MRKEVTETEAIVQAAGRIICGVGLDDATQSITFVDLCCGKSLTAALLSHRYAGAAVVAVDRVSPRTVPHFSPPLQYVQADVLTDDFQDKLMSAIAPNSPIIICGMHLCGALSPCAVELATQLPNVVGLVLSPCCLPSNKLYDNASVSGTRDPVAQYDAWCTSLAEYVELNFEEEVRHALSWVVSS